MGSTMLQRLMRNYVAAYRGLPAQVWLLSAVLLVNRSGTMVLPFFALYATSARGLSPAAAGQLLSLYGLGALGGNYLGGRLTESMGAIRVQFFSLILSAAGFLWLLVAQTQWGMGFCLLFLSLAFECYRPAAATATAHFAPPELHSRAFALNRLAVNLGFSIGPALGGFLASAGFQYLFYVDAATCLLAAVVLASALGLGAHPARAAVDSPDVGHGTSPWRDRPFLRVLLLMFLNAVVIFQMMGTFALYLQEHYGFNKPTIGLMIAINTVTIVLAEMPLVRHTEHFSRLRLVGWGSLLVGLGFGLLAFGRGMAFCAFTILVWTLGEMLASPSSIAYVCQRADDANRGSYLGMFTMSYSAAVVVAPLVGTRIYEINPDWVWYGCLAIGVVVWLGFHRLVTELETSVESGINREKDLQRVQA